MRNTNLCSLLCCPVPCQVDGAPVLCISASLHNPVFEFVLSSVILVSLFYDHCCHLCPSISAFPRVSCVVVAPPAGHRNAGLVFRALSLLSSFLFFFSCIPSGLVVPSFCWSITWTYHGTDCASKQQPCPLGTRPAPCAHA